MKQKIEQSLIAGGKVWKRWLSLMLTFAVIITMIPVIPVKAEAEAGKIVVHYYNNDWNNRNKMGQPRLHLWYHVNGGDQDKNIFGSGWNDAPEMTKGANVHGYDWYSCEGEAGEGGKLKAIIYDKGNDSNRVQEAEIADITSEGIEVWCVNGNYTTTDMSEPLPSPVVEGKKVTFHYFAPAAASVNVNGSFDNWGSGLALVKGDDGYWTGTLDLDVEAGNKVDYAYKFVVDGNWIFDPMNMETMTWGNDLNSKFTVDIPSDAGLLGTTLECIRTRTITLPNELEYFDGTKKEPAAVTYTLAEDVDATGVTLEGYNLTVSSECKLAALKLIAAQTENPESTAEVIVNIKLQSPEINGNKVTFLYDGRENKPTNPRYIVGLNGDWEFREGYDLTDEDGDGVYERTLELPAGEYTYKYRKKTGETQDGAEGWMNDDLNPNKVGDNNTFIVAGLFGTEISAPRDEKIELPATLTYYDSGKTEVAVTYEAPTAAGVTLEGNTLVISSDYEGEIVELTAKYGEYTAVVTVKIVRKSPVVDKNKVTFYYENATAKKVHLVGIIGEDAWAATEENKMTGADGVFESTLTLTPGKYYYKFVVDGEYIADPLNKNIDKNGNSWLAVAGLKPCKPLAVGKAQETDLPAELERVTKDGESEKVAVTWSTTEEGVTIADGKILVGDDFAGDTLILTAEDEEGNTADVTVKVSEKMYNYTIYYYDRDASHMDIAKTELWVWDKGENGEGEEAAFTETEEIGGKTWLKAEVSRPYEKIGFLGKSKGGNDVWDWSEIDKIYTPVEENTTLYMYSGDPKLYAEPQAEAGAKDPITVKFHYSRKDNDYTDWGVWIWENGKSGESIPFEVDADGDAVATYTVKNRSAEKMGYIVKRGDWLEKDPDGTDNQYFDIADVLTGTVHFVMKSGKAGGKRGLGADAVTSTKILSANYKAEDKTVEVKLSGAIEGDAEEAFTIAREDSGQGIANITSVTAGKDNIYTLNIEGGLDEFKAYTITYQGYTYEVTIPSPYSSDVFEAAYTYAGNDLGAAYTAEKTSFRVWAPTADEVYVNLYEAGTAGVDDLVETAGITNPVKMTKDESETGKGTWTAEIAGDWEKKYYTYSVTIDGKTNEACDPYARTTGVNGQRAMIIDLASTNPAGWETDKNPHAGDNYTDAVIYELHVRDLSSDKSSGISQEHVGKFLGLTETGTHTEKGTPTGLDHMKDLGITHIHLLPSYDYGSVDETKLDEKKFNWGYDPVNYNVPEGSYSTDPYNGETRVKEMKQMVKSLHDNNISVIMDVVYNHVYNADKFCFNQIVPKYFSRTNPDGSYSNGSGCGNDTASERSMVRKYIIDSVNYWADEYHIDGFRFDLVGLLDAETIKQVVETVHEKHPDIIFYGEGWEMSTTMTKPGNIPMATYNNPDKTPDFAYFSDTMRDLLKGNVGILEDKGYASGATGKEDAVISSFKGILKNVKDPKQTINYASCHDNYTLMDKINVSTQKDNRTREEQIKMNNLAAAVYMTSEGIPLIHAGEEMLRTKVNSDGSINHNSYNSPDSVNSIKWYEKDAEEVAAVTEYYKGLIEFRKAHAGLRLQTEADVNKYVEVLRADGQVVAMHIKPGAPGEVSDGIVIIYNASDKEEYQQRVKLPAGTWGVYVKDNQAGTTRIGEPIVSDGTTMSDVVAPITTMILVNEKDCAHKNTEVRNAKDATCETAGYTGDTYCTDCHVTITKGEVIEALGHKLGEWTVVKEPTETEDGLRTRSCEREGCNYVEEEVIKHPDKDCEHKNTEVRNAKDATCVEAGYTGDTYCKDCQAIIKEGIVIAALGHKLGEWTVVKEPSDTEDGLRTRSCEREGCNYVEEEVIKHQDKDCEHKNTEVRNAKDATCVEVGYTGDTYCMDCQAIIKEGTVIAALGHKLGEWTVVKEPSDTEDGLRTRSCEREGCNYVEEEVIKHQDKDCEHKNTEVRNAKDATCVEAGYTGDTYCKDCQAMIEKGTEIAALGHKYGAWTVKKEPTETAEGLRTRSCERCGNVQSEAIAKKPGSTQTTPVKVSNITLNKTSLVLFKGKTVTLKATVKPDKAANKAVEWTTSNKKVVTVKNGKITAIGGGTATVTVKAKDGSGRYARCKVTVPYTITYKLIHGKNNSKNPATYTTQKISLKAPTKKGYDFVGWYTEKNYKHKVTKVAKKDCTLYAKWKKVSVSRAKISSCKIIDRKLQVKYKPIKGVKGYEIYYSTEPKFKKSVKRKVTTKTTCKLGGIQKGKTYYVKVHAYKLDSAGKKVYGKYSSVKKIKVNK